MAGFYMSQVTKAIEYRESKLGDRKTFVVTYVCNLVSVQ